MPFTITPSTGKISPSLTKIISFKLSVETSTTTLFPSTILVAVLGAKFLSFWLALSVRFLASDSKYLPTETNVTIIAEDSKYKLLT